MPALPRPEGGTRARAGQCRRAWALSLSRAPSPHPRTSPERKVGVVLQPSKVDPGRHTQCEIHAHTRCGPDLERPSLVDTVSASSGSGVTSTSTSSSSTDFSLSSRNGGHSQTLTPFPERRWRHGPGRRGIHRICFCFTYKGRRKKDDLY